MIVTFVNIWVKEQYREEFLIASEENHIASVKETGNLRFDILQDSIDPNKFVFYEAYDSEESAAAHKNTAHYLKWRHVVANMMEKPRKGDKHIILHPTDISLW